MVDPVTIWPPTKVQLPSFSSNDGSDIGVVEQVGASVMHDEASWVVVVAKAVDVVEVVVAATHVKHERS